VVTEQPTRGRRRPQVSVALPVRNGADTLAPVIESVLAQTCADVELVISDNASTDGTEDLCRAYADADPRVVYRRHPVDVGLLNNFVSAAQTTTGTYVRWIGDDDWLAPDFVARVLEVFREDPRRVVVTTELVYGDETGVASAQAGYDPTAMSSPDPVRRLAAMLQMLTNDVPGVDPLYATIRRDLAAVPRRNMMREDQVFAVRLALGGPWGHVAAPLAGRHWSDDPPAAIARLLGVPEWRRHVRVLLQCRELDHWIARSPLDAAQRRRARAELVRFYARGKRNAVRRRVADVERLTGRSPRAASHAAG
jgi:glycosyltransferase involved in cell wall biosynthesis